MSGQGRQTSGGAAGTPAAGMLLADIVTRGARTYGNRAAVHARDRSWTHAALHEGVCRLADVFLESGVRRGTPIAVLCTNRAEFLQALFAASWLGAVVVPLNHRLSADDIRFQLADSGATHALVEEELAELAEQSGTLDLTHWVLDDDLQSRLAPVAPHAAPDDLQRIPRTGRPDDPIVQLYTAGTTGRPKGCLLTQAGWLAANLNLAHRFGTVSDDVLLGVYPLFHVAGLGLSMTHLMAGGSVVFPDSTDHVALWAAVARHHVTVAGFPGLAAALRHPAAGQAGSSLRILFAGANMESTATLTLLSQVLPRAQFLGIYGSTEGGNVVAVSTSSEEAQRPGTIGRPLLGFDVAILDEADRPLPPGREGVLGLRGPSIMVGYAGRDADTAEALRSGWLHTGDIMRLDENGFLYFVDRAKDMVKPGGENVYCIEVERALLRHPAVADVAVHGVPDERWGEAVKALVVLAPDAAETAEELDAHCLLHLAAFKRPRWYEFTDQIPRSVTGKIVKRSLREAHDPRAATRLPERSRP